MCPTPPARSISSLLRDDSIDGSPFFLELFPMPCFLTIQATTLARVCHVAGPETHRSGDTTLIGPSGAHSEAAPIVSQESTTTPPPSAEPSAAAQLSAEPSVSLLPSSPELVVGELMEVQGCGRDCPLVCFECEWELCKVIACHGGLCEVRIISDGAFCQGVQRRHMRQPTLTQT